MKNPDVDAYIAKSAAFACPILARVRAAMHKGCPRIEETIKWGVPHFEYRGMVGSMAAFKQHASFGFWKQKLMQDPAGIFPAPGDSSMGGRRFRSVDELPAESVLVRYVKAAVALNEQGLKLPNAGRKKKAAGAAARGPRRGAQEKRESDGDLRSVPALAQARVRRVDHRGEAGDDAHTAPRHRGRMDGRRQAAPLEVPELLSR